MRKSRPVDAARILDLSGRPVQHLMLSRHTRDAALAHGLLRLVLGINVGMHGLVRISGGVGNFVTELDRKFAATHLPVPLVNAFGLTLPFVEAGIGLLVILGLFSRSALVIGMLTLATLTVGSSVLRDYPALAMQILYGAVYAWLLAHSTHDLYSLDAWLTRRSNRLEAAP